MNKRIKELAKQAGYTPLEPRTFSDDLQEIFLQKFAESIVKECINVCDTVYKNEFTIAGISQCIERMKKHFGVEK